jgi:hypothetical protein
VAATAPVRRTTASRSSDEGSWSFWAVLALVTVVPLGLALTVDRYSYDIWGAFIWGPALLMAALPLTRWIARRTGDPGAVRVLMAAAFVKIVGGGWGRFITAQAFYDGGGDSRAYDRAAEVLAPQLRRLDFTDLGKLSGTRFVEVVTGAVQAVIGNSYVGSFLVFSTFGFVGLCLFYLALCEGVPTANRTVYRAVLFFTPTMWFWPSSIGKEAFMLLCLGAATFGAVLLFRGRLAGLVVGGLGLWGTVVVRPHLGLIFLVGMAAAVIPLPERGSRVRWWAYLLPLVAVVALPFTVARAEAVFGIDDLNVDSAEDFLSEVNRRTTQGGSEFTIDDVATPGGYALGVVTVLLRPFPWEAGGIGLASSLEALVLTGLIAWAVATRWRVVLASLRDRLPRLALGYVLAFAAAFSAVGNFGILARQRSLMFPFLFVFLAVALSERAVAGATTGDEPPYSDSTPSRDGMQRRVSNT